MLINSLGVLIANSSFILSLCLISRKKMNYKKFVIAVLLYVLLSFLLSYISYVLIKLVLSLTCMVLFDKYLNDSEFYDSFFKVFTIYAIIIIYELLFSSVGTFILDLSNMKELSSLHVTINESDIYSFIYNCFLSIVLIVILRLKIVNDIYNKYINLYKRINKRKLIYMFVVIALVFLLIYILINKSNQIVIIIVGFSILIALTMYILFKDLNVRNEYEETKEKYSNVQESLIRYEDMIDRYRVNNHENKNQLLTIQNMIKTKDKSVNNYIDNLVGNVYMNNEKTMMDISVIPSGGLRATIHTKLNTMDNKNIKYVLNIDRKIRIVDFENIDSNLNLKICKVVSIFIDNAIDEVETHESNKVVNIEMYLDSDKLVIEISNLFMNEFDINKIYEKRYTTKSNGHGYGLSLAKELIDSEKSLENYNKVEDNIFTQVLEISLKKEK